MKYLISLILSLLLMCAYPNAGFSQTAAKESDYIPASTDENDGGEDEDEEDGGRKGGADSVRHGRKRRVSPFHAGQVDICGGIGLVPLGYSGTPMSVTADVGVSDAISIGGYFGMANAETPVKDLDDWYNFKTATVRSTIVGVRVLYHFDLGGSIDAYAGTMFAYASATASLWDASGVFVGGRFRFTRNIGVFLEAGYGVSIFNAGLNLRL